MGIKCLDDHISEMQAVSEQLLPYTFPRVSRAYEADIEILKQRKVVVDGYEVILHFSRADYEVCYVESLQIIGASAPFLPMYLVCKLGAKFLGSHELKYVETFRNGRKVYIWTVALDENGKPVSLSHSGFESRSYEEFNYSYISFDSFSL